MTVEAFGTNNQSLSEGHGAWVACFAEVGESTLRVDLVATGRGSSQLAVNLLVLHAVEGVHFGDLAKAVDELGEDPPPGKILDFGQTTSAIVVTTRVDDARSAAIAVSSEALEQSQLRELAEQLSQPGSRP